ncbi:MAG TPA: M1 family metallopeptidase [Gemmatimonadales bacterium]|nr:M1 family metallopeptidase [Gemmatimonadales bacterium]
MPATPTVSRALLLTVMLAACARSQPPVDGATPARAVGNTTIAEPERPRPYPVEETAGFRKAVEKGTRTRTGRPGPNYWQQWTRYRLTADYDPATGRVEGTAEVRYFNRSPDALRALQVHVYDNMFAPEAMRTRRVPVQPPVTISRVAVRGEELAATPRPGVGAYRVNGTVMSISLTQQPLAPGDSVDLSFRWSLTVPADGAPRGGRNADVAWVSYWYPQLAVYDDVVGWQVDQYMGNGEFYMGYGDYEVSITVPAGHVVAATGDLVNVAEVLTPAQRDRYAAAARTDSVVHVIAADEVRAAQRGTRPAGKATWRFRAENVRDFVFGVSHKWAWDVTRAVVGDRDGNGTADTTRIQAFWVVPDSGRSTWQEEAGYARHSIEFLSQYLWPYPYPHATAIQGPQSCGGMEFPMITCIGAGPTGQLYGVTVHELGHIWFPMQVGNDEKRHAWQDEGLTEFNQVQAEKDFHAKRGDAAGRDFEAPVRDAYLGIARAGLEEPLMRHADKYESPMAFGMASYMKPATILMMLRGMLGEQKFMEAYRAYGKRWQYKHPKPYDLWNTFDDVSGQDHDWFWRTWFYETWQLDHAVGSVTENKGAWTVVIDDKGLAPMPAMVRVTRADGNAQEYTVPVEAWLRGAKRYSFKVEGTAAVQKVEIDPDQRFPDIDRSNNTWTR